MLQQRGVSKYLRILAAVCLIYPLPVYANEGDTTTTTTTTIPTTTTTTIPGETEEVETFDGPLEEEEETTSTTSTTTTTTTTSTTTTTVPTYEQATDIELPEDQLDINGDEVENNIVINNHYDGQFGCTDFCMNLHYMQHGNDSEDYTFILPETTTVEEEELDIEIYEVGFTIGALNNEGTVTYTHTDETTQENVLDAQSNSNLQTMLETVVYNIYDTLDTFIESFTITINDWSLLDDISFKYVMPTTTTTTTTTTLPPPPPEPEPEPEIYIDPYIKEDKEVILDDGTVGTYSQSDIDDGTVERDNQRQANLDTYGCALTDEQIERGDCDVEIIEEDMEEIGDEFFDDVDIPDFVEDEYEEEEFIELTEEEILELEKEMELDVKKLELEDELEILEFENEEELEEFIETYVEIEEFLEEFDDFEEEVIILEIPDEIEIIIEEEDIDDWDTEFEEIEEDEFVEEIIETEIPVEKDEEEIIDIVVEEKIEELEEVIEIEIEEDLSDEEVEEAIEVYVQELEPEEVVEVLEEVVEVGIENLDQATEEVQEVIQAVVEEAIEDVEDLTEEQIEVVAEVLNLEESDDVEIIAEAVKDDEVVAEAVEEYVERAIENKDVENYTLADVVTEVQFETFLDNPIETFVDIDLDEISISTIGDDMTQDQKEKAQEVVVPVILTRIASMSALIFRKTI